MYASDEIILRIKPNGSVFVEEKGLTSKEKEINPNALLELIKGSLEYKTTESYGSMALPKGTIYYGVIERLSSEPTQVVIMEREKCIRNYNHFGEHIRVGYPKLLFTYCIQGSRVASTYVVAAKDETINNNSGVYYFPYANVFANGCACMGSFRYPQINQLVDLNFFPEGFYTLEHTHSTNANRQVVKELLDQVEDKQFDDNLLIFQTTFKKFIESIK